MDVFQLRVTTTRCRISCHAVTTRQAGTADGDHGLPAPSAQECRCTSGPFKLNESKADHHQHGLGGESNCQTRNCPPPALCRWKARLITTGSLYNTDRSSGAGEFHRHSAETETSSGVIRPWGRAGELETFTFGSGL